MNIIERIETGNGVINTEFQAINEVIDKAYDANDYNDYNNFITCGVHEQLATAFNRELETLTDEEQEKITYKIESVLRRIN